MWPRTVLQQGSKPTADRNAIRSSHVNVPEAELTELRRPVNATKWRERENGHRCLARNTARDEVGAGALLRARSSRRKKMATLKTGVSLLSINLVLYAMSAVAQNPTDTCKPTHVIPLTSTEPPAKIVIDPPLAEPLASRGVAIIQYCAQNLHIAPVFGLGAVSASPRVGHIHVSLDDAPWVWADASGSPVILQGLTPGPHKVTLTLVEANHHPLDKGTITFVMPEKGEH
jgi:Family of unknown function (DUF6130)